jgi:hypothetical protein
MEVLTAIIWILNAPKGPHIKELVSRVVVLGLWNLKAIEPSGRSLDLCGA